MNNIYFISQGVDYEVNKKIGIANWLGFIARSENVKIENLEYYFVSRKKILEINKDFLKHNYETDVITFNNGFLNNIIGEIFICIEVVKENSLIYSKGSFEREILRVIVHGLLHLIGFNDLSTTEQKMMTKKENFYLEEFKLFDI